MISQPNALLMAPGSRKTSARIASARKNLPTGLIGLPVPPTTGSGLAANRNVPRPVSARASAPDPPAAECRNHGSGAGAPGTPCRWRTATPRPRSCRRRPPRPRVRRAIARPRDRGQVRYRTKRRPRGAWLRPTGADQHDIAFAGSPPAALPRAPGRSTPIAMPSGNGPPRAPATSSSTPRPTIGPILSIPQRVAPLGAARPAAGKAVVELVVVPGVAQRIDMGADMRRHHNVSSANWNPPGRRAPAA